MNTDEIHSWSDHGAQQRHGVEAPPIPITINRATAGDHLPKAARTGTDKRIVRLGVVRWFPVVVAFIIAVVFAALVVIGSSPSPSIRETPGVSIQQMPPPFAPPQESNPPPQESNPNTPQLQSV
jgi:hypothetical protein